MRTSDTITAISPAIVKALGKIEGAAKTAANEAFKRGGKASTYATLADAIDASRDVLCECELAIMQGVGEIVDNCILITTRLLHTSGEWFETTVTIPLGKIDAQGLGSATTYGRRYALMAMLNMAPIDDDGNAAQRPNSEPTGRVGRSTDTAPPLNSSQAKKAGKGETAAKLANEVTDLVSVTECLAW